MLGTRLWRGAIALTLVLGLANCAGPAKSETIQVTQLPDRYEFSVPVSRLLLTVPRGGFVPQEVPQKGSMANPRYFYLHDPTRHLILSGWFEPAARFPGMRKSWDDATKEWQRVGRPVPRDVAFTRLGHWDAVFYNYDTPVPNTTNTHLTAHWVQAGTWIDVHLSLTSPRSLAASRAILQETLQSLQVRERP